MTRVVIVDDEADFRLLVRSLLGAIRDAVSVVGEASDGEEGLAVVHRERPDILITDLVMPRMDGIQLTRRIRADLPKTKICLISSYAEDAYRLRASDSGADAFVSKQVVTVALIPAIRDLIRRNGTETPYESQSGLPC